MMRLLQAPGKMPFFSEIALIIALAWMISGWLLPASAPTSPVLSSNINAAVAKLPALSTLLSTPLFGKITAPPPPRPVVQTPKPISLSPLTIKLLGTVVAAHSAAIIALAPGREQRVFFIGDSIQPGVILKTVEAESIVVERGGKLERISLEHGAKLTSLPSPAGISLTAPTPLAAPGQTTRKSMSRSRLDRQLKNFPALLSQARVIPHLVNGRPNGFTISEIVPGSLYQQAGLKNGDIILNVNGQRISGAKQAMNMYQTLQHAAAIDLELIRAGHMHHIHYDIR